MEFGGVSVPGRNARTDGAYLLKDLSAFEAQLGGLTAFIMVSDGTGDGPGSDVASQLAVKAADTQLGSVLRGIATGQAPVVEPVAMLKAVVAAANTAVMGEASAVGGTDVGATFVGAFVSANQVWFGQIGGGSAYVLREDDARLLVAEEPPAELSAVASPVIPEFDTEALPDDVTQVLDGLAVVAPAVPVPTELGREGVRIDVGTADLNDGDVVVLLGRQASEALSDADVRGIACAACDARVAAADLAATAANSAPERSVTLAIWSSDSSLFTPVPEPEDGSSPVVIAANNDTSGSPRAEKIFLWVMTGLIVAEVLALVVMAFLSKPSPSASTASTSVTKGAESALEPTSEPTPQPAVAATVTQEATAAVPPADTEKPEYPKKLKVPENVSGGLWLRKKATTLGGDNLVIKLKAGAEVEAVEIEEAENANGDKQEFYIFEVSDIDSDQVVETGEYSWPPSKSVKRAYAFAPSFEEVQ